MKELKALFEFKTEFCWSKNILDKSFNTTICNIPCTLYFPRLYELWFEDTNYDLDYLHMPLKAPSNAGTWYIGEDEKEWGYPISYPDGVSIISDLFFVFNIQDNENIDEISKKLYDNILPWKNTFYKYLKLLSKQLVDNFKEPRNIRPLTLYSDGNRIQDKEAFDLGTLCIEHSNSITFEMVSKAITLTESSLDIPLYYELIYSAYLELENNNFRKAVIDASTSLEILLTQHLNKEFINLGISFGEKLLKKYMNLVQKL